MTLLEQLQTLLAWGVLFSFLAILIAGLTNRVVVFYDTTDFVWTLSPFLSILIGGIMAHTLAPESGDLTASAILVWGIAVVVALYGAYMTFAISIRHNGLALGIVVGCFKVLSSVLAAIISLGALSKAFENSDISAGKRLLALLVFGLMAWMMTKLINGEAVYAKRQRSHRQEI